MAIEKDKDKVGFRWEDWRPAPTTFELACMYVAAPILIASLLIIHLIEKL